MKPNGEALLAVGNLKPEDAAVQIRIAPEILALHDSEVQDPLDGKPCGLQGQTVSLAVGGKDFRLVRLRRQPTRRAGADEKFPPELVRFKPYKSNPVSAAWPAGAWDERIRERGWILRDNDNWKLWYTGYRGKPGAYRHLGCATSLDGIHWIRHPRNPLYDKHWVEDMMVVKHQGTYYMFAEGSSTGKWDDLVELLVSDDGLEWRRIGPLDMRLKNGKPLPPGRYGTPTAWFENDTWYLFYEETDSAIWLATSKDLKVWTNVQDEPVMKPGPGEYDRDWIAFNQIIKHKGRYYAYYHGCAVSGPRKNLWCTAIATSTDLLHWEKYPGNPLTPTEQDLDSGIVVHDGKGFRLYTMQHPDVKLHLPAVEAHPQ